MSRKMCSIDLRKHYGSSMNSKGPLLKDHIGWFARRAHGKCSKQSDRFVLLLLEYVMYAGSQFEHE